MDQSNSRLSNAFSGIDEMSKREVTSHSGKRKGPPVCYKPKQPTVDPLPSDGTMKFLVMRQIKEAIEVQNNLRLDNMLCDVILVCGKKKFPCHKIILASASPYFYAMFTHGMMECCKKEIPMNNVEPEILDIIINFVYTADIKVTETTICPLMQAATMLQMPHIVEACTTFLEHQLDPSNCIGIGKFAQQYGCSDLQKRAEKYLLKNFCQVSMNEEFNELSREELDCIISSNQLTVKCESEVYKAVMKWVAVDMESRHTLLPCLLEKIRLGSIPPKFIQDQLYNCPILRRSPKICSEKLTKLFEELQMHSGESSTPRNITERQVIYCIGGYLRHSVSSVEYFNPFNNEWKRVSDVPHPRSGLAACTIYGHVYAVGGRNSRERNEDLNIVDKYNPETNEWTPMPPMKQRRSRVSVSVLDNKLFAIGGSCGAEAFSSAECFDPNTGEWTYIADMNNRRIAAGIAVVNRFLYVVGGFNGQSRLSSMEKYHPEMNQWIPCSPMSTPRSGAGVASLGCHIYVAGGYDSSSQLNSAERYDTRTDRWEPIASMNYARSALNMVAINGRLYVFGGYGGNGFVEAVESYNPETNIWTELSRMPFGRSGQGVTLGPLPVDN